MVATVRGTAVSVKQRHGRRKMDDIRKSAKGMDDFVILCKLCALKRKQHINLYYIVENDKMTSKSLYDIEKWLFLCILYCKFPIYNIGEITISSKMIHVFQYHTMTYYIILCTFTI